MTKTEIAAALTEIGTLLELKGENPFKIRAYQTGARLLEGLGEDEIAQRVEAGTLDEVKGIGEALAQKISELHRTGRLEFYEKLKASLPAGLVGLLAIPGLGAKKVRSLQEKLGVDSVDKLKAACDDGRVAALEGFGAKSQEKILSGIRNREAYGRRHLWIEAREAGAPILAGLKKLPQVKQVESCGSFRRRMETVGDLDFLVATTEPGPVVAWFVSQLQVNEITAQGELKASVRLKSGLQADLRLVPPEQFVFTLHHLTGSKDHNVQMRQRALERGLSLSEWGLFPSDQKHGPTETGKPETGRSGLRADGEANLKPEKESELERGRPRSRDDRGEVTAAPAKTQVSGLLQPPPSGHPSLSATGHGSAMPASPPGSVRSQVSIRTESDLFAALGLAFIPPELREGLGEIEEAEMEKEKPETGNLKPGGPASLRAGSGRKSSTVAAGGPQGRGPSSETGSELERGGPRPRDDHGEVAAAPVKTQVSGFRSQVSAGGLPRLVSESDIRGVFHNHTTASDGHNTLEEMTAVAEALGFEYLGIADHSKSSFQARGLDEARLAEQVATIGRLNASKKFKTWVFSGTECDILPDGRLDFPPEVLATLDYVVVSVHSSFRQDREVMTARIIRAIEQPHVTMLGHLTGRLLLEREAYAVDVDKVIDAAVANGVVIELNASPMRLDMDWRHWRKAAEKGLLTSINPDAHRTGQLDYFRAGVGAARKGWLTKESVVNALPLEEVKKFLSKRREA